MPFTFVSCSNLVATGCGDEQDYYLSKNVVDLGLPIVGEVIEDTKGGKGGDHGALHQNKEALFPGPFSRLLVFPLRRACAACCWCRRYGVRGKENGVMQFLCA